LGLVISQHFCNMTGGEIRIASSQWQGATFVITLPVKSAPKITQGEGNDVANIAWQAGAVATGKRFSVKHEMQKDERREYVSTVLVIDDDPSVRQIMSHYLSQKGFDVQTAASGGEGLEKAMAVQPDVITLDIMMPGKDGWDILKSLKENPALYDVPVILITMVENRSLGFSLGATEYLPKPIDKERLLNVVNRCVRHKSNGPILVVEGDDVLRGAMQDAFLLDGWEVAVVASAESALSSIGENPPALIMLDFIMPTMDGFEFLDQLRHNPRWRDIPVVIVAGMELTDAEIHYLQGKASKVINKATCSQDELLRKIRSVASQSLAVEKNGNVIAASAEY